MSKKPQENSTRLQIDAWLSLFDTLYCYITISILMFTIYYTFMEQFHKILNVQKKEKRVVRRRMRKTNFLFVKNSIGIGMIMISKILQATIGIYSFEGATVKTRIMVTFLSFPLFFLIYGIFLSLTSTDMTATSQPSYVDSLPRLKHDSYFESVKFILPSGLRQEEGMKNARKEHQNDCYGNGLMKWLP